MLVVSASSNSQQHDDRSPLLSNADGRELKKPTPLPKGQIMILMLVALVEPIASQCIYPFINELVSDLDITGGDERAVGYYAGLIESLFFATQALTVFQWSRISDQIGRKPVLLVGIFGLSLSILCFGLSKTFASLVISRCITGALNGNIGVMKSMLGELTDSSNMAQGFALMPIMWSLGCTLGPLIGGMLSRPQDHFPRLFGAPFWAEYPYFLPCGIASAFAVVVFSIIVFFLKEASMQCNPRTRVLSSSHRYDTINESSAYLTLSHTPQYDAPVPLRTLLTPERILYIVNYGILAMVEICMFVLLPLFLSTPIELGGLGQTPAMIGLWMSGYGIVNSLFQAFFFAPLVSRFGKRTLFRVSYACFIPIFAIFPVVNCVARSTGIWWGVWGLMGCQLGLAVVTDMAFSSILMYITTSAPSRRSLGALNGLAQTTASIVRAIGPASATSMFAYSLQHELLGGYAVYVVMIAITIVTMKLASALPEEVGEWEQKTRA
ncbi:MFS general substrate transporter [Pisolithus orientalis]|uniref:MFS general substrate transporter n=1 Tax=Pisolithus orientalis TaxID=936130 RepID=UPI002225018D|nr:MFS general substrate transporter [Pisolithus orientalis]KAI6032822.1 MFS general substrate transporter [Pisolithus orientalis]